MRGMDGRMDGEGVSKPWAVDSWELESSWLHTHVEVETSLQDRGVEAAWKERWTGGQMEEWEEQIGKADGWGNEQED